MTEADGVDVEVDGIPEWRRAMGALTVFVSSAVACLPLLGVALAIHTFVVPLDEVAGGTHVAAVLALVVACTIGEQFGARVADRLWLTPREREALRGDVEQDDVEGDRP